MKKSEQYQDRGLRQAVERKTEATEQMTLPKDFTDRLMQRIGQQKKQPKRRPYWVYIAPAIAVAASIALLVVIHFNKNTTGEQPSLIVQADTTQTTIKKVEEPPLQKGKNTEVVDSVKIMKEKYRMPRPPKRYMAKALRDGSFVATKEPSLTAEPEVIDATELAERAFAEEMRRMELEMMSEMNCNLQTEFQKMTKEIRQRGDRMSQRVMMAQNEDE